MTISNTNARWSYTGDGVTTAFAYDSKIFASSDLEVYLDGVLQGSGYSVSGVGVDTGGAVTFSVAPAASVAVVIVKDVPLTQPSDYKSASALPAETIESDLDRAAVRDAQLVAAFARVLGLADTDTQATLGKLPNKETRKGKVLGFDGTSGDPVAIAFALSTTGVTAFMATVLDDADAAAARATLGFTDTATGAAEGPVIALTRNKSSGNGANNDLMGAWTWDAKNGSGTIKTWAKALVQILDATNASEDAGLLLQTIVAGTLATRATLGQGLQLGAPTGGDKGAGSLNAVALYQNNLQVKDKLVQRAYTSSSAAATGTTSTPVDDTIPQSSEGFAYSALDTNFTPTNASNILRIRLVLWLGHSTTAATITAALFKDADASALRAGAMPAGTNFGLTELVLEHEMVAGTTSAIAFKVRVGGPVAGTVTINGTVGARLYGGVMASSLTIEEVTP